VHPDEGWWRQVFGRGTKLSQLPAFDEESKTINIVIEAAKGSRTKLKYDEEHEIFRTQKVLPLGMVFPFDFGFIPSTLGEDGDPLDVLVLSEAGLPATTVVFGQILGILKRKQTEKGRTERNDRIIAVPLDAKSRKPMQPGVKVDAALEEAISRFFVEYNKLQGKNFRVVGIEGARSALAVVRKGIDAAANVK
jgi:inorganic pyrophosphatase